MPKALKYRTRPDGSFNREGVKVPDSALRADKATTIDPPANDATPSPQVAKGEVTNPTGRQLRMARRIAQKYGLKVSSDQEAVDALRKRGIDPFERSNMLQLVPENVAKKAAPQATVPALQKAPQPPATAAPAPITIDADHRASEIMKIQRDIAKRRRRKSMLLLTRLIFFVGLPTLIAGIYYYMIATPMYATKSEFIIQQADSSAGGAGGLGGLFSGTGLATQTDSISVQSYLLSRDAMNRLDADLGFVEHFAQPDIDPLQRLDPDGSRNDAYRLYQRVVKIGYDPTEGVIKMEVIAADPEVSAEFSEALIGYAEEQVDQLTARLRNDQMAGAMEGFADAEQRMLEAQARSVDLKERVGVGSAVAEESLVYNQIGAIETELRNERLRLDQLQTNPRPNETRVLVAQSNIARLESELVNLRESLTGNASTDDNLARVTAELEVAQQDLATRQLLLQQAAQQLELARIEANRQVRYLSTPVPPIPTDEATYPRSFENTLLAFLVFGGIYLMVSLTAAILKEQVSA